MKRDLARRDALVDELRAVARTYRAARQLLLAYPAALMASSCCARWREVFAREPK